MVNPKGENGAIAGFGAPLGNSTKESLANPMQRGAYVIASVDRKTVIKMLVVFTLYMLGAARQTPEEMDSAR